MIASMARLCNEICGFQGFGGFCAFRAALRSSIHPAASLSFSETSRKNCAVRFSVSGATSSFTKAFIRASSSSTRFPKSSKLFIRLSLATSSSMRLPNSSNRPMDSPRPAPRLSARFLYYRNAFCWSQGGELALPYRWQWRLERWKNAVRGFFGGEQQPRPKLCPACGAVVGISATRFHECGASLRFSLAALSKSVGGLFGENEAPVTTVLLITNILMFGVSWLAMASSGGGGGFRILWGMGGETMYRLGASFGPSIFGLHEWYRLVTAMFLHGGLIHIGFNMMALMQFGPALEELYGSARYLFFYVVTGMFGFLVSAALGNYSLGASGALLGLVGLMLAVTTKRGGAYMREIRSRLISSVAILFLLGFSGVGIDNYAHAGGLALGFALGKVFADRQPMNVKENRTAYALGWLAGLVIIASFVLMVLHFHDPLPGRG